jgi:hypothetical protein
MWIANSIVAEVEDVVTIRYITLAECALWNEHRKPGELRLFTGWSWTARGIGEHQQGLKTYSAAVRDAYYRVVKQGVTPAMRRRRHLRAVA